MHGSCALSYGIFTNEVSNGTPFKRSLILYEVFVGVDGFFTVIGILVDDVNFFRKSKIPNKIPMISIVERIIIITIFILYIRIT